MRFPFHVYLSRLEAVAQDAIARAPGLWASPRAPMPSLRQVILPSGVVVADHVPAEVMRHIIESQPRVIIALIGVIRVLADKVAAYELRLGALGDGPISPALPAEIEVPQ